jgi:hypothetical protein
MREAWRRREGMGRARRVTMALAALAVLAGWEERAEAAPRSSSLNAKVLKYARDKMGEKVGNGECWTLAFKALQAANAQLPGRKGVDTYVFGLPIPLWAVRPGDILQFEKVRFEVRFRSGRGYTANFPHHTAIVSKVRGNELIVIHQNHRQVKLVTTDVLDLAVREGGELKAFRPRPALKKKGRTRVARRPRA